MIIDSGYIHNSITYSNLTSLFIHPSFLTLDALSPNYYKIFKFFLYFKVPLYLVLFSSKKIITEMKVSDHHIFLL